MAKRGGFDGLGWRKEGYSDKGEDGRGEWKAFEGKG
jgi:hypothetical protein